MTLRALAAALWNDSQGGLAPAVARKHLSDEFLGPSPADCVLG
jgi:hypothetical protein